MGHFGELLSFPGFLPCIQGRTHVIRLLFVFLLLIYLLLQEVLSQETRRVEGKFFLLSHIYLKLFCDSPLFTKKKLRFMQDQIDLGQFTAGGI